MADRNEIVVGVAESPSGAAALRYALDQAAARRLPLALVRAWQPPRGSAGSQTTDAALLHRAAMTATRQLSGVEHRECLIARPTLDVLLEAGRQAALLVVGAGGRTALSGRSTTGLVARLADAAPCPVVVVPGNPSRQGPVVLGVDGSAASMNAAEYAFETAARSGSSLHALLGYPATEGRAGLDDGRRADLYDNGTRVLAESLSGLCRSFPDVVVTREVTAEDPVAALLTASAGASLVVLGSHRHGAVHRRLYGSVTAELLAQAACPVTVVGSA